MSTKSQLLELLIANQSQYISGQTIASALNISRNSIWKAVEQLRGSGYDIESKPRVGYRLSGSTDILTDAGIKEQIKCPCNLSVYDTVDSTNNVVKSLTLSDTPSIVVANHQTAGRGRLGRNFFSPPNAGLYISIGIKPSFDLNKSMDITMATAVAVCRAIEKVANIHPKIKWVNDLFVDGKKICGILTEGQTNFETGKIDSLIVGIGVNCFSSPVPKELESIVGAVTDDASLFARNDLAAAIINEFLTILDDMEEKTYLREYRTRCFILGKSVFIHPNLDGKAIKAKAIDIDDNGGLIIEYMEGRMSRQMTTLTTGEVSIRLE